MFKEFTIDKILMGRLKKDEDLLISIHKFLENNEIKSGKIEGIGAIQHGKIGYYDQIDKKYKILEINEPMEITSLIGNISLKEGHPFAHCHISLADKNGNIKGGHLVEGCKIFAFEFVITAYSEAALVRGFDEETKLPLWIFLNEKENKNY